MLTCLLTGEVRTYAHKHTDTPYVEENCVTDTKMCIQELFDRTHLLKYGATLDVKLDEIFEFTRLRSTKYFDIKFTKYPSYVSAANYIYLQSINLPKSESKPYKIHLFRFLHANCMVVYWWHQFKENLIFTILFCQKLLYFINNKMLKSF